MLLSNLSIKRPVFATVMVLALVTLGIASYRRLAVDLFPNVEIPVLSIVTLWPGASPETVEREVSRPIEEAVNPIAGVRHVGSISREGVSQVWIEFELGVRINDAAQEARSKIAAIRGDLPPAIADPVIEKLDFSALPVMSIAVRSTVLPPRDLTTLADRRVKRRLENIAGVGRIDLVGEATREVQIDVDPARLEALGLDVGEVVLGLQRENADTPVGRLAGAGREFTLRVAGRAPAVDAFRAMTIASRGGRPIALGEVADVRDGVAEQRSLARVDGRPAVALDILKQSGANTVGVADAIRDELRRIQQELPSGTTVDVVRDGSLFIRDAVHDVQTTLVIGGLLTVLIVFCFLNSWRSTVITGLTLPVSVISAFIVMNFGGMTLNIMTLMALSLAIGLLIDDAIVVRENIVRHLERGEDHMTAARDGTSEIGLAVTATTLSIVAVFVPVAFMKGIVGRFFFHFGLTVAFAVLVSLFVSFTLDPMLSSRWVDPDVGRRGRRHVVARVLDRFNAWFDRSADGYRRVVGWVLDHRAVVVAVAAAAFLGGLAALARLESEFMPGHDQSEFEVSFRTAPSASIEETRDRVEAVERVLRAFPEVERIYAAIAPRDADTVRDARLYVRLVDPAARTRSQAEIQRLVRARLYEVPGIVPSISEAGRLDDRKPLLVRVRGEDLARLREYALQIRDALYRVPGLVDLEVTLEHETPEYRLAVDRERARDAGLDSAAITQALAALVGGRAVSTFEDEEGEARDVRVRLPEAFRRDVSQVERLRFAVPQPGAAPALVPLGDVARYRLGTAPSEIDRQDLSREVVVSANLDGARLGTAVAAARRVIAGLQWAPGYEAVVGGETETMEESFGYMAEALVLAIVFVYLILAAQFESFVDPLAIMLSLPLSIVGMAGLLLLTGDTINIMSLIGLILLMGLVTKNAILLVDFTRVLRERGLPRREALVQAGRTRLRPIVMTTLAMIFGMLPLAFEIGAGSEIRAPMARAVIGGLVTSTLLTLLVVPVVYTLLEDLAGALSAAWRRRRPAAAVPVAILGASVAALLASAAGLASAQEGPARPVLAEVAAAREAPEHGATAPAGAAADPARSPGRTANGHGPARARTTSPLESPPANAAHDGGSPPAARAPAPAAWPGTAAPAAQASGTAGEPSVRVLTLAEALALAAEHNRDVQKAVEYQRWVQGKYVEERAAALPHVDVKGSVLHAHDESQRELYRDIERAFPLRTGSIFPVGQDVRTGEVRLTQVLFTWGQVGAAIRAAKIGVAFSEEQLRRFRQAVTRDVATAFYDVLVARELATIARQHVEQRERHLEEARRRRAAGTATDYDVLAAEVAVANARPARIRAENAVRTARARLRFLLADAAGEVDAAGDLAAPIQPAPDYEAVLATALANRPEVRELAHQRGIATELVRIAAAAGKPRVDFAAGYGRRSLGVRDIDTNGLTWDAGVFMSFPVFDGRKTAGRVAQARSDLERLRLDEAKLREGIAVEVRVALDAVREAEEILAAISGTVAEAERLLFMAEKGYEFGAKTYLDVQDAQLNLSAARGNLAVARRDYRVALLNLRWVSGMLDDQQVP
jgi:HAE1 family hydrophobic/amphiphilic exporter-1